MDSWLSYWNAPNKTYVGERHKRAHYDVVFTGILPYLPAHPGVVLDWGCGDALAAERVAEQCGNVLLYDGALAARERLRRRYGGFHRIQILDEATLSALASDSIDIVIVNSVIQYLSPQQLDDALILFHRLLRPGGKFLVGDVISPGTSNLRHVTTFLHFAWQRRFLLSAVNGLARTFVSSYRSLQHDIGLAVFTPDEMLDKLARCGFSAEKLPRNIAVSQHRSSYLARKPIDLKEAALSKQVCGDERGAA